MSKDDVIYPLNPANTEEPEFGFECPGCGLQHWFKTKGNKPCWSWNEDFVSPTISPSINVGYTTSKGPRRCHFSIAKGMITFCDDCTHPHKGQTLPLPKVYTHE